MDSPTLVDKYADKIKGILNCYDRVVITGTLPEICFAQGMTSFLYTNHIRIFDYPTVAKAWREQIRHNAEQIAAEHELEIEFIRKSDFRKEKRIKKIIKKRGNHPGLVHIFSAMETCHAYQPWYDKIYRKAYLKNTSSKCLHYYFYFIDEQLGLCYIRVPTWCPFKLQIYFNGHSLLAAQLTTQHIEYVLAENAFVHIADFDRANQLGQKLTVETLHQQLDRFSQYFCPVVSELQSAYHWSIMQAEYATDIIFKRQQDLQTIYSMLVETLIHSVKPENIATFLGKKLHTNYQGEVGNNFNVRIMGSRIRHQMGPVAIKMYDKYGLILRIEVTVNDVSFFKQYRQVQHRDGSCDMKYANMRKSIYSLNPLRELLSAATMRYLHFISHIETPEIGVDKLTKLTQTKHHHDHRYKGFNLLSEQDVQLFRILVHGEFMINGFKNIHLRVGLHKTTGQISRLLKRLHVHGLIKRIGKRYKYYLTKLGRQVIVMALKLREIYVIPHLAFGIN
jgi:hypothetical protein